MQRGSVRRARPLRKCIGCGAVRPKGELIRLTWRDGKIVVDREGVMGGRGGYVCRDRECVRKACRGDRLGRAFRRPVRSCSAESLWAMIEGEGD